MDLKPTLAIIFLSVNINRDSICKVFDEKRIEIFGSTAAGEFINGELEKESAAILLLDMDKNNFLVHIEERSGKSKLRTAAEIGKKGLDRFSNPAYLVATGVQSLMAKQLLVE